MSAGAFVTLSHILYFAVPLVLWLILRAIEPYCLFSRLYLALVLAVMFFPTELIVGCGLWLMWLAIAVDERRSLRVTALATIFLGAALIFTHPAVAAMSLLYLVVGAGLRLFGRPMSRRSLFAAACDVVVASEDAIFSISETRWGLMAGIILPQLCQAMGLRQVRRDALTGERFGAAEARRLGLVHEVCPTGGLEEAANRIVEAVLMNAPAATTATKLRSLASARAFVDDGELRDLIDEHARTRQQDEAREGLASFKEKRKPGWYPED